MPSPINNFLRTCPDSPGIYKFFHNNQIIYIGKAKNLSKRVRSYFTKSLKDRKTEQIKKLTDKIETFITHSEAEALILEQQLIKENKPRFNILLRDDKTFPYIYFSMDKVYPSIELKRVKQPSNNNFFGPYTNVKMARINIKEIQKIFNIRNCSESTFANRSRPCIEFQMKRCSAPCVNMISKNDYLEDLSSAKAYLTSEKKFMKKVFEKKMITSSNNLDFEEAEKFKQKIIALEHLEQESSINNLPIDVDILSMQFKYNLTGVAFLVVRNGKVQSTWTQSFKKNHTNEIDELAQRTIFNRYFSRSQLPDRLIILNQIKNKSLIQSAINKKFRSDIKIVSNGIKGSKAFISLAKLNANQIMNERIFKKLPFEEHITELAKLIKRKNDLSVECLDISHHSSSHARGAIIHLDKSGFKKSKYRIYKIPKDISGDDVNSIKHVLERRLKNKDAPDVLLIDGGKNQLNAALNTFNDVIGTKFLSISKGMKRVRQTETIHSEDGIIQLQKDSHIYKFLIKARDEAHRFAIKANRQSKLNSVKSSRLDKIEGIGPILKRRLIKKYGSTKAIGIKNVEELMQVKGISKKVATAIYEAKL
ncbi:excinuclease ABC subunit UvrC [SAR86 cluster bacterium]|nr:excinuclease ABC subunit UvrC [SAR86 cluster bacterium]